MVALLSLSLSANRKNPANVTGVDLRVLPANYLKVFGAFGVKRVGAVYSPDQNGAYLQAARSAAEQAGITLVLRPANTPKEAVRELGELTKEVDALWLVPDSATLAAPAQEALFSSSLARKEPVVGFLKENLRQGAAAVLAADWQKMGRQAGEEANRLLEGAAPREVPPQPPRSFALLKNDAVLKTLGLIPAPLNRLFP